LIPLGVKYWGTDPSLGERNDGSSVLPPNPSLMSHQSQQVAHTVNHTVTSNLTGNSYKTEDLTKLERLEWYIPADTSEDIVQELQKLDGSLDLPSINMI
jgi:Fic family protein